MHANVHDRIVVLSAHLDEPNRSGEILEVRGADGAPPYQVRWSDTGHEGLYFPGAEAVIHPAEETLHEGERAALLPTTSVAPLSDVDALSALYSLDAEAIEQLRWDEVAGCPEVHQKVLWRLGDFAQALLRYGPGATTPGIPHLAAHHHIWVVAGTVTIAGRPLGEGSYMHVPPGVSHLASAGADGCTILQMHRPHSPSEAKGLTEVNS